MKHKFSFILIVCQLLCISAVANADAQDIVNMLHANNTRELESVLTEVQRKFEAGEISEIELRNTYRSFYSLDSVSEKNLRDWAAKAKSSYSAHLALGIFLKKKGLSARGTNYVSDTPKEALEEMDRYFKEAIDELELSMTLARKPSLSIFHLLDISISLGNSNRSASLLELGNRIYPENALIRDRYLIGLLPRWGGSYSDVERFIQKSEEQGVSRVVVLQLQAIKHDDIGHTFQERKDFDKAQANFNRALQLGAEAGGTFRSDFLSSSRFYMCQQRKASPFCP